MNNISNIPILQFNTHFVKPSLTYLAALIILLLVTVMPLKVLADEIAENPSAIDKQTRSFRADTAKVYKVVDSMPEMIGGVKEIYKHISYPKQAVKNGVEGRVFISFVVDENGKVQDPKILKGIGAGCGDAAISAIEKVKFKPGQHKGKVVKVQFSLPVTFKLQKK